MQHVRLHEMRQRRLPAVQQHGQQLLHMLVFGSEAGAHNVVAASHQLDQLAPDVGVWQTGGEEHGVAALQAQHVEEENGENADVGAVLRVKIKDEGAPGGTAAASDAVGAEPCNQRVDVCFHKRVVCSHEGRIDAAKCSVRVGVVEADAGEGGVV